MSKAAIFFTLFFSFSVISGDVYKCTKPNGTKMYSQDPCGDDAILLPIKDEKRKKEEEIETYDYEEVEKQRRIQLASDIINELPLCGKFSFDAIRFAHRASVGMTKKEVKYILGNPTKVNESAFGNEIWTYKKYKYNYEYVHFKNGCVTYWSR